MSTSGFRFPWNVREYWAQTIALPLLSMITGIFFVFSCVQLVLRSVPGLNLNWWSLPFAVAILVFSTGLGTLQYSLGLPYSIRMVEVISAIVIAVLSSQGKAGNAFLNVGVVVCAWVLSMHFSLLLHRIRPAFTVELGDGLLKDLVDKSNQDMEKNHDDHLDFFAKEYPAFIIKLGKVYAFCVLMSSLVRPPLPEILRMKALSGLCAAGFMLAALLCVSIANSLNAARGFSGKRYRIGENFMRHWLAGVMALSIPLCILALLLPSALSPVSSSNLSAVSDHFNGIMSNFTDWIGGRMLSAQQWDVPYESLAQSRSGSPGWDIFAFLLAAIIACLNSVDALRKMSVLGLALSVTAWSLVAVTSLVSLWIVSRAVLAFIRRFRSDIQLPAFPLKLIISILLWPLGLYRLVRWLIITLFRKLAGIISGSADEKQSVKKLSLKEIMKLFQGYANSVNAWPKDPIALIRYIFGRIVVFAHKWGVVPGKGGTARDYSEMLSERFPQLKNTVDAIRLTYEHVRYGAKGADEEKAGQIRASYYSLMKAYRRRQDR